jgi:hypothetical protein
VSLALAACGSVSGNSQDARPSDGRSNDAPSGDAPMSRSIVSVHRVFEMRAADQTLSSSITTGSGKALIIAAGSGKCASGYAIGMAIKVDGTIIGTSQSATNELNSSKAFVRNALVADLTAGSHTLSVEPLSGTTMGASEFVDLTVIELGASATATSIFGDAAPPFSQSFTTGTGQGLMLVGGSGYVSGTTAATIGMDVQLDSQSVGQLKTYTNEGTSHKTFGAAHMVLTLAAATRTLDLVALEGTSVDYNDRASALWLQLGSDATLTEVIDQSIGPLPVSNTFASSGRQVMVLVSGSGFATSSRILEVPVQLDSVTIGSLKVMTAESASHKTLVPTVLLAQPSVGMHTLTLATATGTVTDYNDRFNVTVIELGP